MLEIHSCIYLLINVYFVCVVYTYMSHMCTDVCVQVPVHVEVRGLCGHLLLSLSTELPETESLTKSGSHH